MELARSSPEFAKLESEKADLELSLVEMQSKLQAVEAHAASVSEKLQAVEAEAKHPIFGNLVSDFGYKKIYAMNPAIVCDPQKFPIWEFQRSFRRERALEIANFKQKDQRFGFPGAIVGYEVDGAEAAGRAHGHRAIRGVLDGQHRIGGLHELLKRGGVAS